MKKKLQSDKYCPRQSKQGKANDKDKEKPKAGLKKGRKKGRNQLKHVEAGMYERQ